MWRDTAPWKSRAHGDFSKGDFLGGVLNTVSRNDRDTLACHDNNTRGNMGINGDNGSLEVHRGSWNSSEENEGEEREKGGERVNENPN